MKRNLLISVLLALVTLSAYGQQIPDAPSASGCSVNGINGREQIPCDQVPPFIVSNDWKRTVIEPDSTSFFKGRRWTDPPLRTNQEILHSKSFRLLEIGIWGSVGADLARNWGNKNNPTQPHGGELLVDALVPCAVNTAMLWGSYKYIWAPIGVGTGIYGIFIHTRSAINGVYH